MIFHNTIKWVAEELKADRNDTIHDLLAYLAEQMIEMNKKKNEEIKDFLRWLEREVEVGIESLSNKTAIKEYHEHDFKYFLEILKKNKRSIPIDPSDRKTQELFERHFTKSMSVLEPLKAKIKNTDNLIDEIVYRLYGLNDDETRIVTRNAEDF
ncbi:MAG: hypothetical protein HY805_05530 [Nitrospirae bacterium]|nr:hypothetical protein [Nitrospirota bacterium]